MSSSTSKGALVDIFVDGKKTQTEEIAVDDLREYPIGGRLSWYYNEHFSEWPERAEFRTYWAPTFAWSLGSVTLLSLGLAALYGARKEPNAQSVGTDNDRAAPGRV